MSTNRGAAHAFYCGSAVDDFGLSLASFRLLFHLSRRKNKKDGCAKCGIRSIARVCEMHVETVIRAVRDLENQNIIKCERSLKRTTRYYIQPLEDWKLLSKTEQILLAKTEQNCSEIANVRYSGIPKGIPKKAKRERTRSERSSVSRKVGHQKKPFAVATEESIRELQTRYPRLDVRALFPEAQKACAEKYQNNDPMGLPFFEDYLDKEEQNLEPPSLTEGKRIKAELIAEATQDREEMTKNQTPEDKREQFIATLHVKFPQINVPSIAERYLAELDGKPWDNQRFNRLIGEAQDAFWKSLRGDA